MTLKMFSVRDAKAETFNPPFFKPTHGEAERAFRQLCKDEKSMVASYPDDFDLYYLGEYDDNTGKFQTLDTPQHLIKAIQCIAPNPVASMQQMRSLESQN
ncbi:MAG: nonstructural protein [Arizlama microvirus]|nr:MAG: nonstructural protein [Arizlama microvirus]